MFTLYNVEQHVRLEWGLSLNTRWIRIRS